MRFRPWPKPEPYRDTSRKRAAFKRKQRLEREALPLLAEMIAAGQHSVDEEMARRHVWRDERERVQRVLRATRWREARASLFSLPDDLRRTVRKLWRGCPYPADPTYLLDLLHQIAIGRVDPHRPPWIFDGKLTARTTPNASKFDEAFRQIGHRKIGGGPKTTRPTSPCSAAISVQASCFCAPAFGQTTQTRATTPHPAIGCATPMSAVPVTGSISKSVATARMPNST
ncbi:MAG: hypothetical protein AB7S46_17290 [Flavobacteriaceae bacterium]